MTSRDREPGWRKVRELVILLCRLTVGGIFLYASLDKIADPTGFAQAVHNYRLAPLVLLHPVALLLPWLEAVVGAALILGLFHRGAALLSVLMTVLFIVVVTSAVLRHLDISCGCFHTDSAHGVGINLLLRDLLLLAAALIALLGRPQRWTLTGLFRPAGKGLADR